MGNGFMPEKFNKKVVSCFVFFVSVCVCVKILTDGGQ